VCLTLDGFKSHVNVDEALKKFASVKIRIVKEEAGTSHVNQPYDQQTAQADKRTSRQLLDMARTKVNGNIDQWKLIGILIVFINNLKKDVWMNSFIKVNLHPKHRVDYMKWVERISSHVITGESAYKRNTASMYDAMPAFW
jgi:hypothetical protein